jgi:hypothetical protein
VESGEQLARAAAIPVGRDIEVDGLLQLLNPAVLSAQLYFSLLSHRKTQPVVPLLPV